MNPVARRAILVLVSVPFILAGLVLLENRLFGLPVFTDPAAVPLALMGLAVTWVATLVLLRDRLLASPPH